MSKEDVCAAEGPIGKAVKLSSLAPGSLARVASVTGTGRISRRLKEMGVVPGVSLRIIKTAPFGDPFEVRLLGYSLAIRRSEADLIEVVA
ncbi:MAG: ferrous iron transport protein A [Pyrinomonadaceae bacterium]